MSQHTPGPWEVNGSTISGRDPVGEREDYNESPICTISHGWRNREIDKANARLIVKAPKMLETLKEMLGRFGGGTGWVSILDKIAVDEARALLREIEGPARDA